MKTKTLIVLSVASMVAIILAYPTLNWVLDCRKSFSIDRLISLIDSRYTTFIALALAFGWLASEVAGKSKWLRIALGVGALTCISASFKAALYRQQGEIEIR